MNAPTRDRKRPSELDLQRENEMLRRQLEEATEALEAIRTGQVDALVVHGDETDHVFTLKSADHPYRVMVEQMTEGAATLSEEGTILYANRRLAEMLGVPVEQLMGSNVTDFLQAQEHLPFRTLLKTCGEDGRKREFAVTRKPGDRIPTLLAVNSLDLGGLLCYSLLATDLTEQRHAEELRARDRIKDDFLAMLAHELRNPLAPILQSVHLMRADGATREDFDDCSGIIERQIHHISRLLDDLLDVSRVTRGKIELRKQPIDIIAVLRSTVETCRPLTSRKEHEVSVHLPAETIWVEGDPVRLEQVFCNLLNNAAKYTSERGRISMTVRKEDDFVVVHLRDSGIGIPPEMLSSVFDLFTQLEVSLHRSEGGLGIGLTLVRNLVQLHGGTVEAHSAGRNRGSEFVVRLPLMKNPPDHHDANSIGSAPAESAAGLRILLVEDNRDAAETLVKLLRRWGHDVRHFGRGEPALAAAPGFRPHVGILDIGLPGPDGYQIALGLRRQDHEDLYLLAMSGYGQQGDRQQAHEAGFDDHLLKPVDPLELKRRLEQLSGEIFRSDTHAHATMI
jgi:PAS domain S-box-containing protein